jgi:hypothetical protein
LKVERLEGDEADVFSLNPLSQELPALPKAMVPLDESERDSGDKVNIPYSYQTTRIAATNSRNYLFYASNPNADVLGPYLEYCSNRNDPTKQAKFGLLFLSSYSQVRVYRVSAYRRCAAYSCGNDLVKFVTFDGFSRKFGRECNEVFNVSVRSLEYLNEENIAVTVVSSPVTGWNERISDFVNGTSRTYWLNPATMRVKNTIWQAGASNVPTDVPQLCPELQRLPRLGTFLAEVLNAGVFLVRYAVFGIVYTPGLVSAWSTGPRCPQPGSALAHSALVNCGEGAFSLDDFFDSLDDAGTVFWHSLSLLARLVVTPSDKPEVAAALTDVLDGMSQYGQGAVDLWAGGRSILYLSKVPIREEVGQLWATVRAGTLGDAARMLEGLSMPGAGVLAWSRFIYKVFSTYGLVLLKRFLDPLADLTLGKAFTLFWAGLYDLREEFTTTVTGRIRLACGGLQLMFGGDNPWALLAYHECAAGAELMEGMLSLILDIFVQIPMARCVCKDSAGQNIARFVTQRCAPSLPVTLLPTLYSIANQEAGTVLVQNMACARVLDSVSLAIGGSMDAWFSHQFLAADALGSSVDYLTGVFDDGAGKCLDFQNDPHVVVIVPQPVDYFQRCGRTTLCKQVCSAEWGAFQAAVKASTAPTPQTVTATVESLFFPGQLDGDLALTNATAVVELDPYGGLCLSRSGQTQDLALMVAEVMAQDVRVQVWCSPQMASTPVYRAETGGYGPLTVPGALLQVQFADKPAGAWLAALSQLETDQGVFVLNASGVFRAPPITLPPGEAGKAIMRLENLWVLEGLILVDVLARQIQGFIDPNTGKSAAEAQPVSLHFTLTLPLHSGSVWRSTPLDLLRFGRDEYWYTKPAGWDGQWLFLPRFANLLPFRVQVVRAGMTLAQKADPSPLRPVSFPAMHGAAFSPVGWTKAGVLAVSRDGWDWLKQVRLASDGYVEGVFGSTRVDYTLKVDGNCNERGCEGCASLQVQRLCNAYSRCSLINCVGTPVHQRRPMCGMGGLLRQTGRMGLVSTQGAWSIFTEMLALSMRLSLLSTKEAYLLWPEDKFMGYMCQAKDRSAVFFSIFTAILNSALQLGNADIGYMYGGASNVDTNADAVLTISSTAINAFMHQIFLYPLYGLAVAHQILMCQVSGVIALVPGDGFTLRIRGAQDTPASDLIAGQCLTVGAEVLASFPTDDTASLGYMITSMAANALQMFVVQQIEPALHIIDGFLAYLLGIVRVLGALIQSQTMARCNPPDFYLQDVVHCACGDHRLRIAPARRKASAHWCTGVLGMIDSNNQPYYVYNKYSYEQLQQKASGMAAYVACVSGSGSNQGCVPPNEPFFAQQGVTLLNVLVKCRENYVKARWDPAAFVLYQPEFWNLLHFQENNGIPLPPAEKGGQACLTSGDASTGSLAQRCLEGYLLDAQISADEYWAYERPDDNVTAPEFTDGCLVFSGPADEGLPVFEACTDGGAGGCTLPQHLWTPRSANDVPLATQHRVLSHGTHRDGLVQTLYSQAKTLVLSAIQSALQVWNSTDNPAVNAEFFSVEGDVLHQTMDCIMMGPYSRMDYWPTPPCAEGEECLRGPYWSRDEGGGAGRNVDPASCTAPSSLPFTCGSPGRQALMRYLVLNMLPSGGGQPNQNLSNVGVIIRSTLTDLAALWSDTSRYGCLCGGNTSSPLCCAINPNSSLLPPHLNGTTTSINAQTVLRALEDDMALLHELSLESRSTWMRYMADVSGTNETAGYDWTDSPRVVDEARLNPNRAASTYTEPMSPLLENDATLWDVCHASLKQVFFTLPTDKDGTVLFADPGQAFDGDPAKLQDQVRRFTAEAFFKSPLFRHYLPRHAPSESQMCEQDPPNGTAGEGTVSYGAFVQDGRVLLDGKDLPSDGPAFHPQRFPVGQREGACLCGWAQAGSRCTPSARSNTFNRVCRAPGVACAADNSYDLAQQPAVLAAFSPDWYCPEFELSPVWGFLDPSAQEEWLALNRTTLATSSRDLFRHGRGGLRPGNLRTLPSLAKQYLNPTTREIPLERARQTTCRRPPPPESLLQPFLDELFPASQGVDDAGATAYCLRYAIELARLEVLALLDLPELQAEFLAQRGTAEVWRKRCGAQLHLLHLCVSMRVFRPLRIANSRDPVACPFFRLGPSQTVSYATPQCLVSVDGVFYDPCAGCLECKGPSVALLDPGTLAGCRMGFDPRRLLQTAQDVPLGWVDGEHPLPDPELALLDRRWARWLLDTPDATGNVLHDGAWWSAEGPMDNTSAFCDTVLDWWPEDWTFPVGYHVTVPCEANLTAYRSFGQAFALDEDSNTLWYQHELLRDAGLVDSHFGGGGLCRAGTFGMPMVETNSMRYCTRMPLDDTEDFTLPLEYGDEPTDGGGWTDWKCTSSSTQLPWPTTLAAMGAQQSSRFSVGTIPNMPPETSGTYPATDADMFEVGPWQDILAAGNSWGLSPDSLCQDYQLLTCKTDASCPSGFRCKGRVCSGDGTTVCAGDGDCAGKGTCDGVCLLASVQCIRHAECPDEKMCSGLGTCETPVLAVQNRLHLSGDNITLNLAAHNGGCGEGSRDYSLLEASYWGNVGKDLLRVHGMCSFQDWFKYTTTYSQGGCSTVDAATDTLLLDASRCAYLDLSKPSTNQTKWWPDGNQRPDVMFMRPTNCDRDYERLRGFTQCAPAQGSATLIYNDDRLEQKALTYDRFVRLTEALGSRTVRLARMAEMNSTRVGFLGMQGRVPQIAALDQMPFVPCGVVGQCFPAPFTINGTVRPRLVEVAPSSWANYTEKDAFTCGAFGRSVESGCVVDEDRLPLFRYLCRPETRVASCRLLDPATTNAMDSACSSVPSPYYQSNNRDRVQVLTALRDLFHVFPASNGLADYLRLTTCLTDLHAAMRERASLAPLSTGLYFPFMFSLYELPFDWFYQCVVMSRLRVDPAKHVAQTCQAYATRADHKPDDYKSMSPGGDSFMTYLQFVRAGYTGADVKAYEEEQLSRAASLLQNASLALRRSMFGTNTTDFTYPRCSRNLRWRVGPYGDAYAGDASIVPEARAVIWNWYDQQSCTVNWHDQLLHRLSLVGFDKDTWIQSLTVPDPDLLVAQDGVSGRVTLLQTALEYMLGAMQVEPALSVPSQSTGAIRFGYTPPLAYDHASAPIPALLEPRPSVNPGTDSMDASVNRTCAFPPQIDPVFTSIPVASLACTKLDVVVGNGRVDKIRMCNNRLNCSTIPALYLRNGKFRCRYVAETVLTGLDCSEETPGCHTAVMDRIYAALLENYMSLSPNAPVLSPTVFPWFLPTSGWSFNAVELTGALDHERNIQPNPERAVMCEVTTSEADAVKFTACNNPHYKRLQRHVDASYRRDGGVQIPAGAQLEWPLSRSVLTRGVMLSYANQNRPIRQRFLDALFDDETVCKGDPAEHVCRLTSEAVGTFQSLNPWLLGNFNPYEVCDIDFTAAGEGAREYIDAFCLEPENSLCRGFKEVSPDTCVARNQRLVQQTGVPRSVAGVVNDYNLCHHQLEESADGCLHDQGLLGGYDGLPVAALLDSSITMLDGTVYRSTENYTVARNLYEESDWSIPQDFRNGFYKGTNPLWQGGGAPYGYLRVDENDIGGHRLGAVVLRLNETTDTISLMLLERVYLNTNADRRFLDEPGPSSSAPASSWVPDLQAGMARDDAATKQLYQLGYPPGQLGVSCPLQRWAFYSGGLAAFSPSIPAARRAKHLFHRIHAGKLAHPTMKTGPPGQFLGRYRTSNGFCACPVIDSIPQVQCRVPVAESSQCSLKDTMLALLGLPEDQRTSYVFPSLNNERATRPCRMMLDWPEVDGALKDGSSVSGTWAKASDPASKLCHVLDRFRPFQYRYQAAQTLAPDPLGRNTVRDGVCSTSRVVSLRLGVLPGPYSRCLRTQMGTDSATFACNTTTSTFTLPRRTRQTLAQVLAYRANHRSSCRTCAPPPQFRSQQGRPIPPESSFGRLVRLSPERMLAKDLRDLLCGGNASTDNCRVRFNESAWARGEFMRNYVLHPERLFGSNRTAPTTPPTPQRDADWTGKGWVYCPTSGALANGQGCLGTITRQDWLDRRGTLCPQMIRSLSASTLNSTGDPMARTPFCSIDKYTEALCQAIMTARQLITQANCIARGEPSCMPSPYVYHAASYEPSNSAWIHDSVKSFYKRIDARACPQVSRTDQQLLAFAQTFQRDCPANGVNLLAGLIQGVRVLVVDVALIFTTVASLVLNGLQLLTTNGYVSARVAIAKHWAYIRTKAGASLNAFGDIMVDALLNSGEAGARIMRFLEKTCNGLNAGADWFLNVWCNYIQRYMLQFLTGIRKFIGISGATFDMIQDFIDEIFQGVLPAAFVAKYANQAFQTALIEKYSEPSDERKKAKAGSSFNVPDSASRQQLSRTARVRSSINRAVGYGKKVLTGVAGVSKYLVAGLMVWEAVDAAMSIAEEERLRQLYPDNFTLYDLTSINDVVDELLEFILSPLSQQTCVNYQLKKKADPNAPAFSCAVVSLDTYNATPAGTTSVEPTMCWANAAPSVGQNSMFACTGASTCCETAECTTKILCATCPEPALAGITRYGCNSLRQRCACSQTVLAYSRCTANRQCTLDSQCELVSSLNSVSYGTIPCANCPNTARVMCLMPPAGMPARCSCMLSGGPTFDLCSDRTGLRTPVDGSKLCGYLQNRGEGGPLVWAFQMDELVILPCAQVSTGVCSVVYDAAAEPTRMVVAETVRFSSRGGARRLLLVDDEEVVPEPGPPVYDAYESEYELGDSRALHELLLAPGWNTTAAPCSSLVLAYQAGAPLGILETHVLHRCGFWRYVGRRVIARYNLSVELDGHETFLLSMDDFVFAAMKPEVASGLLSNPGILASALMHHPWMKPVRALGVMIANQIEYLAWMRSIDEDVHEPLFGEKTDPETRPLPAKRITPRNVPRGQQNRPTPPQKGQDDAPPSGPRRRLLAVQDVLAYSVRVLQNPDDVALLPPRVFGAWSTEAFTWPPRYNYTLAACPIALTTLQLATHVATVNNLYYQNFGLFLQNVSDPPRSLRANLPDFSWTARVFAYPKPASTWASAAFRWMLDAIAVTPGQLVAFFSTDNKWSLTWLLSSATRCDLASTLTCSRRDRDALMSTVIFVLLFFFLRVVTQALGVSFISWLFLLSYPWFILWYTYGMAPTCFPLLPACLSGDILRTVEFLVPRQLLFHRTLLCDGRNQTCLRPCSDLGFVDWLDPLAFAICDVDNATCTGLQGLAPTGAFWFDEPFLKPVQASAAKFQPVITRGDAGGHRVCTWVNFVSVVPVLALLLSGLVVLSALLIALLEILPFLVQLMCQAVVFYET